MKETQTIFCICITSLIIHTRFINFQYSSKVYNLHDPSMPYSTLDSNDLGSMELDNNLDDISNHQFQQ